MIQCIFFGIAQFASNFRTAFNWQKRMQMSATGKYFRQKRSAELG